MTHEDIDEQALQLADAIMQAVAQRLKAGRYGQAKAHVQCVLANLLRQQKAARHSLSQIASIAAHSRTQTKRLLAIKAMAQAGLDGKVVDNRGLDLPQAAKTPAALELQLNKERKRNKKLERVRHEAIAVLCDYSMAIDCMEFPDEAAESRALAEALREAIEDSDNAQGT